MVSYQFKICNISLAFCFVWWGICVFLSFFVGGQWGVSKKIWSNSSARKHDRWHPHLPHAVANSWLVTPPGSAWNECPLKAGTKASRPESNLNSTKTHPFFEGVELEKWLGGVYENEQINKFDLQYVSWAQMVCSTLLKNISETPEVVLLCTWAWDVFCTLW